MKVCPSCGLQYPDDTDRCFVDRAELQVAADPYVGTILAGRYQIESVLGEGGMATVYRARHTLVDRPVAVKIMSTQLAKNPAMKERFRREAKNAAAVAHPNIIRIDDHGETPDGTTYLVMEVLEGAPLSALIEGGPIPPGRTAELGLQISNGLARAHDFDVIHRDLKPENIFIVDPTGPRPQVKLLDFGIARSMHDPRLTNAGEIFGTPQYMAPERVTSIDAGPSADLYALGVILFEMVTGQLPFDAGEITGFFIKHMTAAPPKPSALAPQCPRRLEELILALLAKKPEDRPVDAHQVAKELAVLVPEGSDSVAPPPAVATSRAPVAPTLPPTTLERWAKRAAIFERMLREGFPSGQPELRKKLDDVQLTIKRIGEIRGEGLKVQRRLEELEGTAREARERLGNAVDTLGQDLSTARSAARTAAAEVAPYIQADAEARGGYESAHAELDRRGGYRLLHSPRPEVATALRDVVEALDRWNLAHSAAQKARRWVESKEGEVTDLEFQIKALRAQLEKVEAEYETSRQSLEETLRARGEETETLERSLLGMASRFVEPLRKHSRLRRLFEELETAA